MPEIEEVEKPIEDPIQVLKDSIVKQDDAKQTLIRPLKDNPYSNFSEEYLESKSLKKRVRIVYTYKDVMRDRKLVGRALESTKTIEEKI